MVVSRTRDIHLLSEKRVIWDLGQLKLDGYDKGSCIERRMFLKWIKCYGQVKMEEVLPKRISRSTFSIDGVSRGYHET